ncbi:PREDICTED: outer dense fiber protein 3-like [Amphimedon queenslandica]|uniref:Outer dense fiber protein 3-like protein 2 n=1 Tax=Amphimedon queenslandica TaxID=400682 RepID=A0A1X7URD4_AMPQE|nr:PREDICTED: outer dense fiber protein 3-like [Amphimedon queenslandica]|eukprot:XP_003387090.2 PREDICTED: outer dense fiber protein 3-like [Amphimedon queenslandica]
MAMVEDSEKKTKPIMIAARERGPGPGRYKLPPCCGHETHDMTKQAMPAYSFGKRLSNSMFRKETSPGPIYFIDPMLSRYGRDGNPSYSILGRQKDLNAFKTPSPGAYSPEKVHPQGEKHAPIYSMGRRTAYRKRDSTPSPSSYTLPCLLGHKIPNKPASASYSMASRPITGSFSEDLAKTPGPGCYNAIPPNIYTPRAPGYSMLGRSYMPGDATMKPGPGAYSPERVYLNKTQAPRFSMGIRHSEFITPLILEVR